MMNNQTHNHQEDIPHITTSNHNKTPSQENSQEIKTSSQDHPSNQNKMVCDLAAGICGVGSTEIEDIVFTHPTKKLDLYYVSDPLCSHCWALEPVFQKLEALYGHHFNLRIVMGGLLERWDDFIDESNGINNPQDVAAHWHEVGEQYRMPIDGSIWHRDPVASSYPASIVFKLIQQIDPTLAKVFLRNAREAVLVWNRNIGNDNILVALVNELGLDGASIVAQVNTKNARILLQEDLDLAQRLGVHAFPTLVFVNATNRGMKLSGHRSFETYVSVMQELLGETQLLEMRYPPSLRDWLKKQERLYAKEMEVMYDLAMNDLVPFIQSNLKDSEYRVDEVLQEMYLEAE